VIDRGPIRSVLIANRGEIAARIGRTCAGLGIRAIVPSVDGPAALDLLDGEAVVRAALASGADAVHPGYGFLAESPDFAETVLAAGLRWIGPPPAAIRAMGDKAAARRLAASLGVPVTPGYDGAAQNDSALRRAARRIGYPILVKPTSGGGGKGMRIVRSSRDLAEALAGARREAAAAFGDDRLVLERFVEGPRHVEVQVLFDGHGAGVHLGERDCSVQRRHQKVLEETPSPAVDEVLRARLGEAALQLAAAVGYVSAGTCEFLLADDGTFSFLEMNTRLQVEHPVTEAVTGRDLVADQLRIAAGEPLATLGLGSAADGAGREPADPAMGHAIEVRLYAEDAEAGFLPATGRIEALRWPRGEGVRIDAGIAAGDLVGARFDPLLAKIVVHGRDRAQALGRLARALDETIVLGVVTNLRFLRWLVGQPWLVAGEARVDTLATTWRPGEAPAVDPELTDATWSAAARALLDAPSAAGARDEPAGRQGPGANSGLGSIPDPWAGGWRLNAPAAVTLVSTGSIRRVAVAPRSEAADAEPGPGAVAAVDADGLAHVDVEGRSTAVRIAAPPDVDRAALAAIAHHVAGRSTVTAPMPGTVVSVRVALRSMVAAGDPLVILEAMKMEHAVVAPAPGVVTELAVQAGDQVVRGQLLASVEA